MNTSILLLALIFASAGSIAADAPKAAPRYAPGASASSPELANLKTYEERRYRIDMMDCAKEKAADRRVCERIVHGKAARKSARRGAEAR